MEIYIMATKKPVTKETSRTRIASLVMPGYSLKNVKTGDNLFIKTVSELYQKEDFDNKTGERRLDKKGEPSFIHLVQVQDLDTGEVGEMVIPIIMFNAFQQAGELQERAFELVKGKAEANKATKWEVYEIEA
jgi:hypothetical protein